MPRLIVRRLAPAVALIAMLGLALPASAAGHPHAAKAPAASLLDQLLSWVGSFWSVQHPRAQDAVKTGISIPLPGGNSVPLISSDADKSAQIDPNG